MRPPVAYQARNDVLGLRMIRDIYQDVFENPANEAFVQRIRDGIRNNEWSILA
jgi:hypothetical protein